MVAFQGPGKPKRQITSLLVAINIEGNSEAKFEAPYNLMWFSTSEWSLFGVELRCNIRDSILSFVVNATQWCQ